MSELLAGKGKGGEGGGEERREGEREGRGGRARGGEGREGGREGRKWKERRGEEGREGRGGDRHVSLNTCTHARLVSKLSLNHCTCICTEHVDTD